MTSPADLVAAAPYGRIEELAPGVRRVLAKNPSPFTYTGTGTYIIGTGTVAVIDPGPDDPAHIAALIEAVAGETVSHIVITHTHRDHSPAAPALKAATGAQVVGCTPLVIVDDGPRADAAFDTTYAPDQVLTDGESITGPGWTLTAVHTPGHTSNHICYAFREAKALFTGDHVMGWSTTVIAPPDGDMAAYMASLRLLLGRDETIYYPTHGDPVTEPNPLRPRVDHPPQAAREPDLEAAGRGRSAHSGDGRGDVRQRRQGVAPRRRTFGACASDRPGGARRRQPRRRGMAAGRMTRNTRMLAVMVTAVLILAVSLHYRDQVAGWLRIAPPQGEASAMFASVRGLNRLDVFAASLTAIVTSKTDGPLGIGALATHKTLIVPGTVKYYIDFSTLTQRDVNWDAPRRTLTITLPEPRIEAPSQPLSPPLTYKDGDLVMALTGSEATLDAANYAAAKAQVARLAASKPLMDMARRASATAVTNNLQLPLRAIGADAKIDVRFAGTPAEEKN